MLLQLLPELSEPSLVKFQELSPVEHDQRVAIVLRDKDQFLHLLQESLIQIQALEALGLAFQLRIRL